MQENKSFKGFSKETMTLFILAVPLPLSNQRCSTSFLCHADIWIALHVLNIFSQLAVCERRITDICTLDAMRRVFTSSAMCFKQIEALLKTLIICTSLCCTPPRLLLLWRGEITSSSLSCPVDSHSCCLPPCSVSLPPSLCQDHLCLFYTFVTVGSLQCWVGKSA